MRANDGSFCAGDNGRSKGEDKKKSRHLRGIVFRAGRDGAIHAQRWLRLCALPAFNLAMEAKANSRHYEQIAVPPRLVIKPFCLPIRRSICISGGGGKQLGSSPAIAQQGLLQPQSSSRDIAMNQAISVSFTTLRPQVDDINPLAIVEAALAQADTAAAMARAQQAHHRRQRKDRHPAN